MTKWNASHLSTGNGNGNKYDSGKGNNGTPGQGKGKKVSSVEFNASVLEVYHILSAGGHSGGNGGKGGNSGNGEGNGNSGNDSSNGNGNGNVNGNGDQTHDNGKDKVKTNDSGKHLWLLKKKRFLEDLERLKASVNKKGILLVSKDTARL